MKIVGITRGYEIEEVVEAVQKLVPPPKKKA